MVTYARNPITWVLIALTLGASSLAQSIEQAHDEILATYDSIRISDYPAQLQTVVTLAGRQHSGLGLPRPAAYFFSGHQAMAVTSELILNYDNPPRTPSFQLRNEIMLKAAAPATTAHAMTWTW